MNEEIINKLIDYSISSLDDTTLLIQHYGNMIEFYRKMIKMEGKNKPLFFQKKKIMEYNTRLSEYKKIIEDTKNKLNKEIDLVIKLKSTDVE